MTDSRRRARKRSEVLTVKFFAEESARLRAIADAHFRSPAEQIRYWIATDATAVAATPHPLPDRVPE